MDQDGVAVYIKIQNWEYLNSKFCLEFYVMNTVGSPLKFLIASFTAFWRDFRFSTALCLIFSIAFSAHDAFLPFIQNTFIPRALIEFSDFLQWIRDEVDTILLFFLLEHNEILFFR